MIVFVCIVFARIDWRILLACARANPEIANKMNELKEPNELDALKE